ncbi:ATP-binding protein [Psychroflexus sp. CAK8W]|uniref:ATP-binding protein n=1 Tax=Psychroflexus longus TaxID=2873596 RepID=A0ABS7XK76_9FLAO|nr:ATP-binding protein [Psychroflexus longus]MBZ9779353.1 ATP-binding protein [Psychroflexus longus]
MTKLKPVKNLLIGGPSTGKSTVLEALSDRGYWCFPEVSREVTLEARQLGIEHLFLDEPLKFSEMLLKGRIKQFEKAEILYTQQVFIDRGIPDITAYMDHFNEDYPNEFVKANKNYRYDHVFLFPVWNEIYTQDNERFEDLELARNLQDALIKTYEDLDYKLIEVPKFRIHDRIEFILNTIKSR